MRYVNAHEVLPKELLAQIQQYVQGDIIYILKPEAERAKWGVRTGERQRLRERNESIKCGTYTKRGNYICEDSQSCNEALTEIDKLMDFVQNLS